MFKVKSFQKRRGFWNLQPQWEVESFGLFLCVPCVILASDKSKKREVLPWPFPFRLSMCRPLAYLSCKMWIFLDPIWDWLCGLKFWDKFTSFLFPLVFTRVTSSLVRFCCFVFCPFCFSVIQYFACMVLFSFNKLCKYMLLHYKILYFS